MSEMNNAEAHDLYLYYRIMDPSLSKAWDKVFKEEASQRSQQVQRLSPSAA